LYLKYNTFCTMSTTFFVFFCEICIFSYYIEVFICNNPPTLVTIHFIYAEQHSRFLEFYVSLPTFLHSRLTSFRKKHIMKMIYITPRYSYERNRHQRTSSFGCCQLERSCTARVIILNSKRRNHPI